MAERDFYNINTRISYPLVHADSLALTPTGTLPKGGLVDAGFMLGQESGFDAALHNVTLYEVTIGGDDTLTLDFRSDAPGLAAYRWLFVFPPGTSFGTAAHVDAETISGAVPDPERGWGFLAVGDLTELLALGAGVYQLADPPRIEPALLQSLVSTYVRAINLANDPRACPVPCCDSSSSSSSSSSESVDTAYLKYAGLVGAVKFREGFNARVLVVPEDNAITFEAAAGYGLGDVCADLIIDADGLREDNCVDCDGFIKSFNGIGTKTGKLRLIGGPGLAVVPDPAGHKLIVKVAANVACLGVSSSSSSSSSSEG